MKYELTSNFVIFNGIKLYQIRALENKNNIKKGDLGGYISKKSKVTLTDRGWIGKNSYVINSIISGSIYIKENVIIWNSYINGEMWINNNVKIKNSNLISCQHYGIIVKDTIIINKDIKFEFELDNRIINSGYFRKFYIDKTEILCGNEYIKCDSKTISYKKMYDILKRGDLIIKLETINEPSISLIWIKNKKQLLQECEKELKRLGIKYKEGDK